MSSVPLPAPANVLQADYTSLVVVTAVGYDYILTFQKEVEYIWSKPWTWVSTMFIFVRYFGLVSLVPLMLMGTSFLSGPAKARKVIMLIHGWSFVLFYCSADFVMILRVWAIYNRSKLIISILFGSLVLEAISIILAAAMHSDPRYLTATTIQILDISICTAYSTTHVWTYMTNILQITLGAAMCVLVVAQFARQSLRMYSMNKWQPNRYKSLLVRQGVLYFFGILVYSIISMLFVTGKTPTGGWQMTVLFITEFVPLYALTPRFIMSIREMYARDARGRTLGAGIDNGFGLTSSLPSHGTVISGISFADPDAEEFGPGEGEETLAEAGAF